MFRIKSKITVYSFVNKDAMTQSYWALFLVNYSAYLNQHIPLVQQNLVTQIKYILGLGAYFQLSIKRH